MTQGKQSAVLDYRKKNRVKMTKTIVQLVLLLAVALLLYQTIFDVRKYAEPDKSTWNNKSGFIALSYFGVGRSGTPKLVAKKQLDEHLKALYDQGYVTISQQDILDFYTKGKPLPQKALFLSFEDGRNDSSLFAQPLLEKYNYKATFLSYANKMGNSDHKFLQPKDMLKMRKTGYWELGTNGYRLTYINIFDKQGRYIGMKDENELPSKENVEFYNHYLMDFIRDENMIPVENRTEMEKRINHDYKAMKDIYNSSLGFVPQVYMIMHANVLYEGMNPLVSNANSENIKQLFKMHFNREGIAFNDSKRSLYDLTRVQPAPFWYTNHLLMKIQKDTGQKMKFVSGDEEHLDKWRRISGAAEFIGNRIALTSPPAGTGMLYLEGSDGLGDVGVAARVAGNVVGKQMFYIRYDRVKDSFIRVTIENNEVHVDQKKPGHDVQQVFTQELSEIEWKPEDLSFDKATVYSKEQTAAGAPDEPKYPVNIKHTRDVEILVQENKWKLAIDGQTLLDNQEIDSAIGNGGVALASEYSKQNKKDDIYDGVFDDVHIVSPGKKGSSSAVLFSNKYTGFQGVVHYVEKAINSSIDWAIETF
ncbi:polysaccharide deacetylase family protein [Brevibacillus borstelensis]|uniref:polysaccharide deacetylase family protein n=1 Tax=Brevibacillus borstelensis TaxID=45462 RepID=UPI0030C0DB68